MPAFSFPSLLARLSPAEQRVQLVIQLCGFTLGALCMSVLMLTVFLHLRFDGRKLAADLVEQADSSWQRKLALTQTPRLSLWPRPNLQFGAATLSEPGRGETFASWRTATIEPALLPLLRGEVVVRRLSFDGLLLRLTRDARGVWNGEDILEPAGTPALRFALDSLALQQADVTLEDLPSRRQAQWRKLELRAEGFSAGQAGRLQMDSLMIAGNGNVSALEGRMTLSARYRVDTDRNGGALTQGRASFAGRTDWAREARLDSRFEAFEWQDEGWQLRQATVLGQAGDWLRVEANLPAARFREGLTAELLELGVQHGESGRTRFELAQLQSVAGDSARIRGTLSAHSQLGDGNAASNAQVQGRANLSLNLRDARLSLNDIDTRIDARHPALQADSGTQLLRGTLQAGFGDDLPTLTLRGELSGKAGRLLFDASRATGQRPRWQARLTADAFDVDRLVVPSRWQDWLPASEQLKDWALDGELRLARLRLAGVQLEALQLPFRQDNGIVELGEFSAMLYGGRYAGRWRWDAAAHRYSTSQTLRGVALDALARDSGLQLPLSGQTNATLEASGNADAWPAPCRSAEGVLRIYGKPANWHGADLARSLREQTTAAPREARAESTAFDELSAALRFDKGELQLERLNASSRQLSLLGSGRYDCRGRAALQLQLRAGNDRSMAALRGRQLGLAAQGDATQMRLMALPDKPQAR